MSDAGRLRFPRAEPRNSSCFAKPPTTPPSCVCSRKPWASAPCGAAIGPAIDDPAARPAMETAGRRITLKIRCGRVAPGIAPWRSHRSGLARLRHPVRQQTDSQRGRAASAEAGRAPLTLSNRVTVTAKRAAKCSPWFPPVGPPVGSALPFTGSSEASSPASTVLWRCATSYAPLAGLGCLRPAIPCGAPVVSLPAVQGAQPRAWGASFRSPRPDESAWRHAGPPKFLENPDCFCARFFDSGRTACPHYPGPAHEEC
jgi:hypothetical protein